MNGILPPVFLYAFMACTQTTLLYSQCVPLGSSLILFIVLFLVLLVPHGRLGSSWSAWFLMVGFLRKLQIQGWILGYLYG